MNEDAELQAIDQMLGALAPLDSEARERVLDYVFRRLDLRGAVINKTHQDGATAAPPALIQPEPAQTAAPGRANAIVDVRTFAAEKRPSSQVEKTVFVAFYLTEVAPESERKSEISGADLEKYQKQADLGAPTNTRQALFRARDAGYLESAGHGKYKLNAVGYNFVAHSLPAAKESSGSTPRKRTGRGSRKRVGRKSARKKAAAKKVARKR